MNDLDLVKHYFELSNIGELESIEEILFDDIVYTSENVGVHFGKENVMKMKRDFFSQFTSVYWEVGNIEKRKENTFVITFQFHAELRNGEKIKKNGEEIAIVKNGKIHFVQVKNK